MAVGRLAVGVTIAQAHADLSAIAARLASQYPATNKDAQPTLLVYHDRFTAPQLRVVYFGLMSAAGVVLIIAFVNVSALLIVRSAKRSHELGIRMALGGSRARFVRETAAEGILLGAASSVTGFVLSAAGVRLLSYALADVSWMMPYWIRFEFDAPILVFAISLCVAVTVLLGLFSLGQLTSRHILTVIRPNSAPVRTRRATVLIAADVVLTLTLLTGAGLMARSAVLLSRPALTGIDTANWLTMRVALPQQKYATPEQRRAFYRRIEEQLTSAAGVEAAAIMSHLPLGLGNVRRLTVDSRANVTGEAPTVTTVQVSSGYFAAIALPPSRGRTFRDGDGASGLPPAVVNEIFAATYFRGEDPLGHHIELAIPSRAGAGLSTFIVGVVPNVRQRNIQQLTPDPVVYVPLAADPVAASVIVVRARPPSAAARLVRDELDKIDRDLPLFQVMPFPQYLASFFFTTRAVAAVFAVFGVIALVICAIGIYAVIGAVLRQRQLEFGVRLAVGARPRQLVWLIVRGTAIPMGIGLMIGGLGAVGVGRALESVISQIPPNDAMTIAAALAGLVLVYVASVLRPAISCCGRVTGRVAAARAIAFVSSAAVAGYERAKLPRPALVKRSIGAPPAGAARGSVLAIPRPTLDGLAPFQHQSDFHRVAIHHCGHDCPNGHAILLHRVRLGIVAQGQDQHVAISVDARCFDCREVRVRLKARRDSSAVVPDSYRVCPLELWWLGHRDDPHAQERLGIRRVQRRTLSARSGRCDCE